MGLVIPKQKTPASITLTGVKLILPAGQEEFRLPRRELRPTD